ncbi:hypothetical protein [Geothrix fuzhouensis]|uniref:hypothetical protein n=1 Tax=Geothrix fuzhouensis TaxID=2966451 RepID=UPI002148DAD8|nr:hypothetical protein [Geothrix fuzhouensis]
MLKKGADGKYPLLVKIIFWLIVGFIIKIIIGLVLDYQNNQRLKDIKKVDTILEKYSEPRVYTETDLFTIKIPYGFSDPERKSSILDGPNGKVLLTEISFTRDASIVKIIYFPIIYDKKRTTREQLIQVMHNMANGGLSAIKATNVSYNLFVFNGKHDARHQTFDLNGGKFKGVSNSMIVDKMTYEIMYLTNVFDENKAKESDLILNSFTILNK